MNEPGIPLDYSPAPKRGVPIRPRYVALGILLVLAAAAYVPLRNAWGRAAERARFASLVRQCLRDAPPPTTIAYEDNPSRAAALAGTPGYTTLVHPAGGMCTGRQPSYWFEVRQTGNWLELWPDDPVLFLHVRRSASGQERLLLVHARRSWAKGGTSIRIDASILDTNIGIEAPPHVFQESIGPTIVDDDYGRGTGLRIYVGQADPQDPSHFTLQFEVDGKTGTIDGWLRDRSEKGGWVEMIVRD